MSFLYYARLPGRGLTQCEFKMLVSNIASSLDLRNILVMATMVAS